MSDVAKRYPARTSAPTWLNAAGVLFLVFGIIAGFVIGGTSFGGDVYSSEATWTGWAFFACGFACFVLFAGMSAVVARLTDIRTLLAEEAEPEQQEPPKSIKPEDFARAMHPLG